MSQVGPSLEEGSREWQGRRWGRAGRAASNLSVASSRFNFMISPAKIEGPISISHLGEHPKVTPRPAVGAGRGVKGEGDQMKGQPRVLLQL